MEHSGIQRLKQLVSGKLNIVLILIFGILLMLLPDFVQKPTADSSSAALPEIRYTESLQNELADILSQIDGAGRVRVLLTTAHGEKTLYQADSYSDRNSTVLITDRERNQSGLIYQIDPPVYQGAVVICQGADRPAVVLAITQAVSNVTGLGFGKIVVLKMT